MSPEKGSIMDDIKAGRKKRRQSSAGHRMQWKMLLFLLVVLVATIAVPYRLLTRPEQVPVLARFDAVQASQRTFHEYVTAEGQVQTVLQAQAVALVPGVVDQVFVKAGDDVTAGSTMIVLKSLEAEQAAANAAQSLSKAEGDLATLDLDIRLGEERAHRDLSDAEQAAQEADDALELAEELLALGGVSRKDVLDKELGLSTAKRNVETKKFELEVLLAKNKLKWEQAEVAVQEAKRKLEQANTALDALVVQAPLSGRVLSLPVRATNPVTTNAVLATVADVNQLKVAASVPAGNALAVKPGMPAQLILGDVQIPAQVEIVAPQAESSSEGSVVPVQLSFDVTAAAVVPNVSVTVQIETGKRSGVVSLPRGPYFASGEGSFVYVVEGEEAVRRDVVYGSVDGNFIAVKSGLEVGETVITSSYETFKDFDVVPVNGGARR